MKRVAVASVFVLLLLVVWHLLATSGRWSPLLVPTPLDVARYLVHAAADGTLLTAALVTMKRLGAGYLLGLLIGFPLGCLTARFRACRDTLGILALALQSLPSVCWALPAQLWFGQTEEAMLFVVVMGTVWSILIATDDGLRSIPPIYVRAARTMGSSGLHTVVKVLVPASLPVVLGGMKQGWAFAWRSLMAAEIFVSVVTGVGLGWLMQIGRDLSATEQVVGIMIVIVLVGLVVDQLVFAPAERWIRRRWGTGD